MIDKSDSKELAAPSSDLATFCLNLSHGLHAAAQPLAILRASLDGEYTDRLSLDELRKLTTSSAVEVERVCNLFSLLQLLVNAECVKPHLAATPLLPLLADAADGVALLFEQGRVCLKTNFAESCHPVLIDSKKTLQAFSNILLVAYSVSRAGDTVELTSSASVDGVRVTVQNPASESDTFTAEVQLSMHLAEANISHQNGNLTWTLKPFHVDFDLRAAPSEP